MATIITKTLKSSGGDYSLMSTWEAAITADLVTNDEQWVLECYADWTSPGLNNATSISGHTTDSTRNIIVKPAAGEEHNGVIGTGFQLDTTSQFLYTLSLSDDYTEVIGITINHTASALNTVNLAGAYNVLIDGCILSNSADSQVCYRVRDAEIRNCLIYEGSHGIQTYAWQAGNLLVASNNTIANMTATAFDLLQSHHSTVTNNVAYNNVTGFSHNTNSSTLSGSHNADDDGTASALSIGTITAVTSADFTDTASDDYSLNSGSQLKEVGTDLSGIFTTDITGYTRS